MLFSILFTTASIISLAHSCADHTGRQRGPLRKRAEVSATNASQTTSDWAYEASYNWGAIQAEYADCQAGTQQSPIALSLTAGLSSYHQPIFENYDRNVTGKWTNWGYGPGFTLDHPVDDYTTLPTLRWDNETAYLKGWHVHAPADHSVGGDRSKAEIHLVHVDAKGHETAVLAIRLDPGTNSMPFFAQLPTMVPFERKGPAPQSPMLAAMTANRGPPAPKVVEGVSMNMELVLEPVKHLDEFWTYKGSLTSPPCMEGIRWFVARTIAFTSVDEMRGILSASTYSARQEQEVWLHEINSA